MTKKNAIVHAATALFAEKGFKETSMSALSKLTGAAEGTIFYHFKSKEGLFLTILDNFKTDIIGEIERYFEVTEFNSGQEMVEGAVSFYLHLAGVMENRFLLLHRHDAHEFARVNSECREYLSAIYDRLVGMFERGVLLGQEDGSIGDMATRKTALIIFSMVDGLIRLNTYGLYHADALYDELMATCRRMLENRHN